MMRHALAITTLGVFLVGCQAGGMFDPGAGERGQRVAFAATADYPEDAEATTQPLGAVIDGNNIVIYNFSERAIRNATVWVNEAYVAEAASIPGNGRVSIPMRDFYDVTGRALTAQQVSPTRVQIQTQDDQLYNLLGPVRN